MNAKSEAAAVGAMTAKAMEAMGQGLNDAADHGRALLQAGADAWGHEVERFIDEFSEHGSAALKEFRNCRSPMELLAVEQAWFAARSKIFMESGLRFAKAFAAAAGGMKHGGGAH